jgi:hypothetical protein
MRIRFIHQMVHDGIVTGAKCMPVSALTLATITTIFLILRFGRQATVAVLFSTPLTSTSDMVARMTMHVATAETTLRTRLCGYINEHGVHVSI